MQQDGVLQLQKDGCGCICIEALKEELAWAIDKQLLDINNMMLFKTVIPLRN